MEVRPGQGQRAGEAVTTREGEACDGFEVGGQGERVGETAAVLEGGITDGGEVRGYA